MQLLLIKIRISSKILYSQVFLPVGEIQAMKVNLKEIYNKQKAAQKLVSEKANKADRIISSKNEKPQTHKLIFNEKNVSDPNKAFDIFESKVTKIVTKKDKVDPSSFFAELNSIFNKFIENNKLDKINKSSVKLAEKLVGLGDGRLAAIIYSLLIKANSNNVQLVEHFATSALAIAKRINDPVHIMARCEDLRKIYSTNCPPSEKLLRILYEEKRALNFITKNYEGAQNRFQTISKQMKPIENYKIMQAGIQIEIAKILKNTNKTDAIIELESAYSLLSNIGQGKYTKEIKKLLREIKHNN